MIKHPEQSEEECKSHILGAFLKKLQQKHREKYGQQVDVVYDFILSSTSLAIEGLDARIMGEKRAINFNSMARKAFGKMRRDKYNQEV